MSRTAVYIFGNNLLEEDSLPIKLLPDLQKKFPKLDFIWLDPNENLKPVDGKLYIIDTVLGLPQAMILKDLDMIEDSPRYSLHDFDLGFNLKLLKKIGSLQEVTIFCLPVNIGYQEALTVLVKLINGCFSAN